MNKKTTWLSEMNILFRRFKVITLPDWKLESRGLSKLHFQSILLVWSCSRTAQENWDISAITAGITVDHWGLNLPLAPSSLACCSWANVIQEPSKPPLLIGVLNLYEEKGPRARSLPQWVNEKIWSVHLIHQNFAVSQFSQLQSVKQDI